MSYSNILNNGKIAPQYLPTGPAHPYVENPMIEPLLSGGQNILLQPPTADFATYGTTISQADDGQTTVALGALGFMTITGPTGNCTLQVGQVCNFIQGEDTFNPGSGCFTISNGENNPIYLMPDDKLYRRQGNIRGEIYDSTINQPPLAGRLYLTNQNLTGGQWVVPFNGTGVSVSSSFTALNNHTYRISQTMTFDGNGNTNGFTICTADASVAGSPLFTIKNNTERVNPALLANAGASYFTIFKITGGNQTVDIELSQKNSASGAPTANTFVIPDPNSAGWLVEDFGII